MNRPATPPPPPKRLRRPWILSALTVPARMVQSGAALPGLVTAAILALFVAVALYYGMGRPKSFFLDVTTDYLQMRTDRDTQIVWDIPEAVLCLPRHNLPPGHPAIEGGGGAACAGDAYGEMAISGAELDWPDGIDLILRSAPGGGLDILMRFDPATNLQIGGVAVVPESILRLPREVFDVTGGLGLSGDLVIGQTAEHGTLKMLRAGVFETREIPFLRSNALLVDRGELSLGDVVSVRAAQDGARLSSYAFLTPAQSGGHLRVIATTPESDSRLVLQRARANPSTLEPNWSQRIASDPLAIGLATLLSLLATFLGVLNHLFRR